MFGTNQAEPSERYQDLTHIIPSHLVQKQARIPILQFLANSTGTGVIGVLGMLGTWPATV